MTEPSQQPPPNDEIADRVVHEVDGIQEYDNKLPRWWLATFYGAIAFSVVYWYAYHTTGFATLPGEQYKKDSVKLALEEAKKTGAVSDEMLAAFVADRSNAQKGLEVFTTNCVVCHRADGGGGVGPNLTDGKWIYGSAPKTIFGTIHKGIADKVAFA